MAIPGGSVDDAGNACLLMLCNRTSLYPSDNVIPSSLFIIAKYGHSCVYLFDVIIGYL
jgi:hypothetical protein